MKILLINSSLRQKSFGKDVLTYIEEKLKEKGMDVRWADMISVPLFNQDYEYPAPEGVAKIRDDFEWADKVWILTPEYNGAIPGVLKNALDWLSRPVDKSVCDAPFFIQNKEVLVTAIGGGSAGIGALEDLNKVLTRMKFNKILDLTGIQIPRETFMSGVFEFTEEIKEKLQSQIEKI